MTAKFTSLTVFLALAACSANVSPGTGGESGTSGQNGESSGGTTTAGGSSSAAAGSSSTSVGTTGATPSSSAGASSTDSGTGTTGTTGGPTSATTGSSTGGTTSGGTTGGTTGSAIGTPCTYDSNTGVDSCTVLGYECSAEFTNASPAICVLPEAIGVCDGDPNGDVGCQDGGVPNGMDGGTGDLFCSPGFQNSSGPVDLCLYSCVDTTDCPSLEQSCISALGGCFFNNCDPEGPYFDTCPVLASGDGQCLPFDSPNTIGVCFQNGTAEVGDPCNPFFRYGAFSECAYGTTCVPTISGDGGLCFPITVDGGCAAGDDTISVQTGADWAICATDCTASPNCDGGLTGTSCQALSGGLLSSCLP